MEATCAPPKWKFLREDLSQRKRRAERTKVCIIDYVAGQPATTRDCNTLKELQEALHNCAESVEQPQARLFIVEDLSREVIDHLGSHQDIDPLLFASHISDYMFHNTRDRWVELPGLDVDARQSPHFAISYLRARYFKTDKEYEKAECQTGLFNVLRRLDSDRSRDRLQNGLLDLADASVTLTRAKTSMWYKPKKAGTPTTG